MDGLIVLFVLLAGVQVVNLWGVRMEARRQARLEAAIRASMRGVRGDVNK